MGIGGYNSYNPYIIRSFSRLVLRQDLSMPWAPEIVQRSGLMINKPSPLGRDYNRDPIKALKKRRFID